MSAARPHDLTIGLLGTEVPKNSPIVQWNYGHTTILPAVYDSHNINVCNTIDIPIIKYLAQCPASSLDSKYVVHISNNDLPIHNMLDPISNSLSKTNVMAHAIDHTRVTKAGLLKDFFKFMKDLEAIQCVLDIPLMQASLPDALKNLDHGLIHGWNHTTYNIPISSKVHPENFTVKGWALLHHAGFLTYPHHNVEGALTWVRMEVGVKFWVVFWLKN
ncbi:uncharacterized protein EDB91DRAFT_1079672 [Suillus paluster]|uniref:uncharacterized protein n=1 Tax=Suillus paluster TaxID=48578 RepID=UPI001B882ABA|nr:uncharacterized protein EDB91DRAFT_1079672 [Suillus paluster]KAG1747031.1 hypothetical protein EDB91DRAFT_1079672 [Suillus paluster]